MSRRARLLLLAGTVLVGTWLGQLLWLALEPRLASPHPPIATLDGPSTIGSSYELVDHSGRIRTERSFLGKVQVVFFGFTHCPDVCPTGLDYVSAALDALSADAAGVQPLFVTVDPARDTPALLADYLTAFHPSLLGLSGSEAQVARAAAAFRVYYERTNVRGPDSYTMDHTAVIYVLGRDGQFAGTLDVHEPPEVAVEKLRLALGRPAPGAAGG